ncbi:GumC family protein [Candidatus Margulisiibacteriota bacterium]
MELLEYYYIFLRRKWYVIGVFTGVVLLAFIMLLIVSPVYESKAKVLVKDSTSSPLKSLMGMADFMGAGSMGKSDPVTTQIEIIKTRPILREVIETLDLRDKKGEPFDIVGFTKKVKVSAVRNTNVIVIAYRDKDKKLAADIVNTIANVAVKNDREINQEESRLARVFMENQLDLHKQSLHFSEEKLIKYQAEKSVISLDKGTETIIARLSEITVSKIETESKAKAVKAQIRRLKKRMSSASNRSSPFVPQWKQALNELDIESFSLRAAAEAFGLEIKKIDAELRKLPPKEIALARLLSDVKIESEIYNNLLRHLEETKIAEAAQIASIRVIEPGETEKKPVFPKKRKWVMLALFFGLCLGGGVAMCLEYLDQSLRSLEEIDKITKWNRIGLIPKDIESQGKNDLITKVSPKSPIAESYRTLRTNMHYTHFDKKLKTVVVTSSGPGEGKTTVLANLALTQCMLGKKVLLIDSDLRKPKIHKVFGLKNRVGLTNVVTHSIALKEAIQSTDIANFFVLTTGPIPPNPAELIESQAFSSIIEEVEKTYDMVLIDAPPFNVVADVSILFTKSDGYVFVVDLENTNRHMLSQAVEGIKNLSNEPLGYVANNVTLEKGKHLGIAYQYGE